MTTLKGLILKESDRGEASKSICVLTAEKGVIYVFIRGGKKSSKTASSTQSFTYSALCLEEKKNALGQVSYFLNSSEPVKLFYNIRLDAKRLALASYFSQLLIYTGTENENCSEVMRLALNTFYYLNKGEKDMELLKSVFEFRLLCEIGLRPELVGCSNCFAYESDQMHFSFHDNDLLCSDCYDGNDDINDFVMDKTMLYIIRFIALTEFDRLFAFKISSKYQKKLTLFTERFVGCHLNSDFSALDFYRKI